MSRLLLSRLARVSTVFTHTVHSSSPFISRSHPCLHPHATAARSALLTRALSTTPADATAPPPQPPTPPIIPSDPQNASSPAQPQSQSSDPPPLDPISSSTEPVAPLTTDVPVDTTVDAATAAADAVSAVASADLSSWWLQPALGLINFTHDFTQLPWYLSIAAATVAVRTLLLPITLLTMRNSAKMQALQPDITAHRQLVLEAARAGDQTLAKQRQTEMQNFLRSAGVSPLNVLAGPLFQFPVFISFFIGIRRMAVADPTFATGGIAWFTDLSAADPTYLLPVLCGSSLLAMTELGGDTGSTKMTPQMKIGMRAVAVLSVPMTYWFPAAVFCYWLPNNLYSVALGAVMRSAPAKKALGLQVDPAYIPGTTAERQRLQLERMSNLAQKTGATQDVSQAVAGYLRKGQEPPQGQPVLLKRKPAKRKSKPRHAKQHNA